MERLDSPERGRARDLVERPEHYDGRLIAGRRVIDMEQPDHRVPTATARPTWLSRSASNPSWRKTGV